MTEEKTKPKGRPDSQEQQIQEKTKLKGREDQNEEETKPEDTRETQEKPRHKRRPDEREDQREQRREDWREDQVQGRTRPKRRADSREEQTEEHTGPKRNLEQRRIRAKSRGESSVDLGEFTRFFPLISNMAAIVLSCKSIFSRKNMPSWRKCRPSLRLNKQLRSFLSPQKQNGGNCSFLQEHFPSTKKASWRYCRFQSGLKGKCAESSRVFVIVRIPPIGKMVKIAPSSKSIFSRRKYVQLATLSSQLKSKQ